LRVEVGVASLVTGPVFALSRGVNRDTSFIRNSPPP
jgi:hypothetical protein